MGAPNKDHTLNNRLHGFRLPVSNLLALGFQSFGPFAPSGPINTI